MKALLKSAFSFRLPSGAVHGRSVAAWRTLLPTLMILSASVVADAPCARAADPTVQSLPGNSKVLPVQLTASVRLDLIQSELGNFLGIGAVSVHGTPLRSAAHPMLVRLDTPEGILYTRLKFRGVEYDNDGAARIQLRAMGVPWGRGEFLDNYGQSLLWLNSANEPVIDDLALILRPASLSLGGRSWTGFSYAFEFKSQNRAIHRLLTHATWEIGGSIRGNTVLSQGQVNRPVFRGGQDRMFTTACLNSLDQYGTPQGYSFQLAPRGGLLQAFDFQYR